MKVFFGCLMGLFASDAYAYRDSLKMTCSSAQAFVAGHDTVMLATGAQFAEFDSIGCLSGVPAFVRTRDIRFCWVGYDCHGRHSQAAYTQGTDELCRDGSEVAVTESMAGTYAPVIMTCDHGNWVVVNL